MPPHILAVAPLPPVALASPPLELAPEPPALEPPASTLLGAGTGATTGSCAGGVDGVQPATNEQESESNVAEAITRRMAESFSLVARHCQGCAVVFELTPSSDAVNLATCEGESFGRASR